MDISVVITVSFFLVLAAAIGLGVSLAIRSDEEMTRDLG